MKITVAKLVTKFSTFVKTIGFSIEALTKLHRPISLVQSTCKGKVKCAPVQAPRLYTGRSAHSGSRGIALLFLDHGTRRQLGVSVTPRPLFTPKKDPVPIVEEAGWAPRPVWTGQSTCRSHIFSVINYDKSNVY